MGNSVKKLLSSVTSPLLKPLLGMEKGKDGKPGQEAVMPDPDDEMAARAEQRKQQRRKRSGRTSTLLSEGNQLG